MNTRVSVVMAVYNGEKYLKQQIDSIIPQLGGGDELIISVDPGSDTSKAMALRYAEIESRVKVIGGPGRGAIKNFENALNHAKGEYIFLSDQDDVWREGKISKVMYVLENESALAVVHDAIITDEELNEVSSSFFKGGFYSGVLRNIIRNRYIGCCMAFRRALLDYALPFPENTPMHDQWLGIIAKRYGQVVYVDKPLIYYRRHGETVTGQKKSNISTKLKWRLNIAADYFMLGRRKKK